MIKNIQKDLKILGFSENESSLYSLLIDKKEAPAGDLIKETGFHRNVVYTALNHLINKKLVSEKIKNSKKFYVPEAPKILLEQIREQSQTCESLINKIDESLTEDSQGITVHEGNDEFLKLLLSLLNEMRPNDEKFILGAGGEDFMEYTMRPIWKKYHQKAIEQKIKISMIAYENQKDSLVKDIEPYKKIYSMKFLKGKDENPAGIHVYPHLNTVLNIIYSDKNQPVTAIKIKNKRLTQGYINLFKNLYSKN
ncbi:MAG: Sugar-specific transcriptional regulator TrmB [Candidatus Parcubacteria bacterium]|jgi:sugar-specific transcriptional regulator TrmB